MVLESQPNLVRKSQVEEGAQQLLGKTGGGRRSGWKGRRAQGPKGLIKGLNSSRLRLPSFLIFKPFLQTIQDELN